MLAVIQYIFYLLSGAFYYLLIATFMGVAAGFGLFALVLLLLPLLLFGFASGLSFFFPRIAAASATIFVLPFLYIGVSAIFTESTGVEPSVFVVPATAVMLVSIIALLWNKGSLWSRQEQLMRRVVIGIFTGIPALLAILLLVSIGVFLSGFQRAT